MNNNKICFFCKNSGEAEDIYTNHTKHTCTKLANINCLKCGGKGHTERYCDNSGNKYCSTNKNSNKPVDEDGWQTVGPVEKKERNPLRTICFKVTSQRVYINNDKQFPALSSTTANATNNVPVLNYAAQVKKTKIDEDEEQTEEAEEAHQTRVPPPSRPPPSINAYNTKPCRVTLSEVKCMTPEEIVDTINSCLDAVEIAEKKLEVAEERIKVAEEATAAQEDPKQAEEPIPEKQAFSSWADEMDMFDYGK